MKWVDLPHITIPHVPFGASPSFPLFGVVQTALSNVCILLGCQIVVTIPFLNVHPSLSSDLDSCNLLEEVVHRGTSVICLPRFPKQLLKDVKAHDPRKWEPGDLFSYLG